MGNAARKPFKARRNGVPATEGWEALWAYVGAILTGALDIDAEGLADALARRRAAAGSRADRGLIACYDATAPGAIEAAWRLYAPVLPKTAARRGPEVLLRGALPRRAA